MPGVINIREKCYDAIISEHVLPGIDGVGTLKHLRLAGDTIPFIFFSAASGGDTAIEALNANADFYVRKGAKPVAQLKELADIVSRLAAGKKAGESPVPLQSVMRMILDSSDEPIVFTGLDHVIIWANKSFLATHGVDTHDAVGRHCFEVVWGRGVPCAYCRVSEVISTGKSVSGH